MFHIKEGLPLSNQKAAILKYTGISVFSIAVIVIVLFGMGLFDPQEAPKPIQFDGINYLKIHPVQIKYSNYERNPLTEIYNKRDYKGVISQWESKPSDFKNKISTHFLVGMSFYHLKQYKDAIKELHQIDKADSPIREWLSNYLGISYYHLNDYTNSLIYLKRLRKEYPDSSYLVNCIELEAKIYLSLKKQSELIKEFSSIQTKDQEVKGRAWYFVGSAYELLKDNQNAFLYFGKSIGLTGTAYLEKNIHSLHKLDNNFEKHLYGDKLISLAQYYYNKASRNKELYHKVIHLINLVRETESDDIQFRKNILLGKAYAGTNDSKNSESIYNKLLQNSNTTSPLYQQGEFEYAHFLFPKNTKKSLAEFKKILNQPKHTYLDKTCDLLMPNYTLLDDELLVSAIVASINNKRSRYVDKILFEWINKKKDKKVIGIFSKVVKQEIDPGYGVKLYYWLGEISNRLKDKKSAIEYFKNGFLRHKRDYYTYKSLNRLKNLHKDDKKNFKKIIETDKKNYMTFLKSPEVISKLKKLKYNVNFTQLNDKTLRQALFLISYGEYRQGYTDLKKFLSENEDKQYEYALVLRELFKKLGNHHFTIHFSGVLIWYLNGPQGNNYLLPWLRETSYPLYFKEEIEKASQRYKVDPLLVSAIIREESRFNQGAISYVGAMGLMQLMPATGRYLLGKKEKDSSVNFFDPELNIRLGTKYISQIMKSEPVYIAVAGYNGGPGRLRAMYNNWKKTISLINMNHFVELIRYDETRDYVKKVLGSYYNYQEIYKK